MWRADCPIPHRTRCRVTGVDAASAMITMCAERFPENEWLVADMRTLALNRTFNGIIAWDSFFHLPRPISA